MMVMEEVDLKITIVDIEINKYLIILIALFFHKSGTLI